MRSSNLNLTFFTDAADGALPERLRKNLRSARYFDVLVGYFLSSEFYNLYHSLEEVEKTR